MLILILAGSAGVVVYLNMRASPSFGHGVLPENVVREARERDYFFVFAFWVWGMWAGLGAVALARRRWGRAWIGVALAALPIALNWRAVDRSRGLEAEMPRLWATTMLASAPRDAVLFVGGDNDTYPLWYAQEALGMRRDVTMVTTPLLPAEWYRDEMERRWRLYPDSSARPWRGRLDAIELVADRARALGRPVAAAISLPAAEREKLGRRWTLRGLVYVERLDGARDTTRLTVDSSAARFFAERIDRWRAGRDPAPAIDDVARATLDQLECPARVLRAYRVPAARDSLDSICNLR